MATVPEQMTEIPPFVPPPIRIVWPKFDLPESDEVPMETGWHVFAMNLLIELAYRLFRGRTDFFAGGNMFIYYSTEQHKKKPDYRGPDFFFVKNVDGTRERKYWLVVEEEGRYPDMIVELVSPSSTRTDRVVKKEIYEKTFHTHEYYCYDPDPQKLEGWRHDGASYQPIPANEKGWLWCEELSVWLGPWEGTVHNFKAVWPRFYDRQGRLVPTAAEEAEAAQKEAAAADKRASEAEAEVARLKKLLEDKK